MTARQPLSNLESLISRQWDEEIVAQLVEYVRIPAKSPHFDPPSQSKDSGGRRGGNDATSRDSTSIR